MWYNANKDRNPLPWRRGRGRLSSNANSGPRGDHTNGNGKVNIHWIANQEEI